MNTDIYNEAKKNIKREILDKFSSALSDYLRANITFDELMPWFEEIKNPNSSYINYGNSPPQTPFMNAIHSSHVINNKEKKADLAMAQAIKKLDEYEIDMRGTNEHGANALHIIALRRGLSGRKNGVLDILSSRIPAGIMTSNGTGLLSICVNNLYYNQADSRLVDMIIDKNNNKLPKDANIAVGIGLSNSYGKASEFIERLVEKGAKVPSYTQDGTPLIMKIKNADMIEFAIKQGASINTPDKNGNLPVHVAKLEKTMMALIKAGADINAKNNEGETPLMVFIGNKKIRDLLLQSGADASIVNKKGQGLFHYLAKQKDEESKATDLTALIKAGADPSVQDKEGYTPLMTALDESPWYWTNNKVILNFVLRRTNIDAIANNGTDVLMHASQHYNLPLVRELLDRGADPTRIQKDGRNCLHYTVNALPDMGSGARTKKASAVATWLFESGAKVDAIDDNTGKMALHSVHEFFKNTGEELDTSYYDTFQSMVESITKINFNKQAKKSAELFLSPVLGSIHANLESYQSTIYRLFDKINPSSPNTAVNLFDHSFNDLFVKMLEGNLSANDKMIADKNTKNPENSLFHIMLKRLSENIEKPKNKDILRIMLKSSQSQLPINIYNETPVDLLRDNDIDPDIIKKIESIIIEEDIQLNMNKKKTRQKNRL